MTSLLSSLYASNIQESREADHVWAATQAIKNINDKDTAFKDFFLHALENWDPRAIELCKKIYKDQTDKDIPDWNCSVCGCSDRVDIHGDLICGCDSCSAGCESPESRMARGCKRRRAIHEVGLAMDTLIQLFSLNEETPVEEATHSHVIDMIRGITPPQGLEAIFDDVQEALEKNKIRLHAFARIYNFICYGEGYTPVDYLASQGGIKSSL